MTNIEIIRLGLTKARYRLGYLAADQRPSNMNSLHSEALQAIDNALRVLDLLEKEQQ